MSDLIMEFVSSTSKTEYVQNADAAIRLAHSHKIDSFRLYDHNGCFHKEFALFEGRYREVENAV